MTTVSPGSAINLPTFGEETHLQSKCSSLSSFSQQALNADSTPLSSTSRAHASAHTASQPCLLTLGSCPSGHDLQVARFRESEYFKMLQREHPRFEVAVWGALIYCPGSQLVRAVHWRSATSLGAPL